MPPHGRALAAWLLAGLLLAGAAGCGTSTSSISDSKIISALNLTEEGGSYVMEGNLFCRVDDLLNDTAEVASAQEDGHEFVIASPKGDVGVLARRPFAPSCSRHAKDALKRLSRQSAR